MLSNFFSYLYMKIEYNNGLLVVVSWVRLLLIRKLFKQIFIWEIMFRIERVNTSIRFLFIFIQFSYLSNFNFFFKSFTSFDWISPIFDWLNQFRLILIKLIDYDRSNGVVEDRMANIARQIGDAIAKLHDGGVAHGDLTTSNMLIRSATNQLVRGLSLLDLKFSFIYCHYLSAAISFMLSSLCIQIYGHLFLLIFESSFSSLSRS